MSICIVGTPKRHLDVGAGTVAVWSIPSCVDTYVNARLYSLRLLHGDTNNVSPFWLKNEIKLTA